MANIKKEACRAIIIAQFGPPALAAIRSWGRHGVQVGLIQIVSKDEPAPRSRYLVDYIAMTADEFLSQGGLKRALSFIKSFKADALLAINEKLACHLYENQHLLSNSLKLMFSSATVTRDVLSKIKQVRTARSVGLDVLPTWEISAASDVFSMFSKSDFPLCLRPAGTGSIKPGFKAKCFFSPEEIHEFLKRIRVFNGSLLAQPFRNYPNLVVHGVRGPDGINHGVTGFIVKRKFEGFTLSIQPTGIEAKLRQQCIAFVDAMQVIGPYHFEFLYDPATGTSWFLELNSRLGGTTAKVMACGYDEPAWTLKAFGYDIEPSPVRMNITASSKKAIGKCLLHTIKGELTLIDYPNEPRWKRIFSAVYGFFAWHDDVLDWHDLPGTLALYGLNSAPGVRVRF